ncbi:response regulator [Gammaproteobacteria bacterium 45_16_T64]|nr:response regulator [Gammaproteobacteria bacterium 45_16_T64]
MKKILVVDDSPSMRQMISFTLGSAGFAVEEVDDGAAALIAAKKQQFDLVISDVNMPKMNGIEMVKALRGESNYRFVPILMLTTESAGNKKGEGKDAGATGWIVKPFNPEQLVGAVNKVLR